MKKYMYIEVYEREINEPTFFDKKEAAIYQMVNDFCTIRDIDIDIVPVVINEETLDEALSILKELELMNDENNVDIENLLAYGTTLNHDNWDAKIFEVDFPTLY